MIRLDHERARKLSGWFHPEKPGPVIASHVVRTGMGTIYVDRWPNPRVMLAETGGNYVLLGDPQAITPMDLQPHIRGFLTAAEAFLPLLQAAFPSLLAWPRIVLVQTKAPIQARPKIGSIRRLEPADARSLQHLDLEASWIYKTWGGPSGLAKSGFAWGAFLDGELLSIACTFFLGDRYEDLGVVTDTGYRGMGLSTACAGALCTEIHARGHVPSWTTSPDNPASLRVAEKLGFTRDRDDVLYLIGIEIPRS